MAFNWSDPQAIELARQKAILAGYKPAEVDSFIKEQRSQAATSTLAEQGVVDVAELAKSNPVLAEQLYKKGVKPEKKLSADEEKRQKSKENADRIVTQLEKLYYQNGSQGLAAGRLGGVIASGREAAGSNQPLNTYNKARESSRPTLARAFGDVGNLSQPEQEAAVGLLPTAFSTPEEAAAGFQALREKLGLPQSKQLSQSQKKNTGIQPNPTAPRAGVSQSTLNSPIANLLASVGGLEVNAGKQIIDLLVPRTKKALMEGPQELNRRAAARPNTKGDLVGSLKNSLAAAGDLAGVAGPAGVESGMMAAPITKLGLVKGGLLSGAATGATTPEQLSPGQRLVKTLTGAAGGGVTGGVLKGGGAITNAVSGSGKRLITQVFRPNASELRDFKKFSGGLDFADEIIKRDLPFIKGKNGQQILEYYSNKVNELNGASDDFLKLANKQVEKKDLLALVDKSLQGRQGRVMQDAANSSLNKLREDITSLPETVDLVTVNQIKRDLQTAGKAAYGPGGNPSPASEAMSSTARELNNLLESKAPGIKDVNKASQFYHLAKDSVERKVNQAAGSEGGIISQLLIGGGAAGVATGALTGNPALGLALTVPALANALYKTPQFKTRAASTAGNIGKAELPDILKKLLILGGGRM